MAALDPKERAERGAAVQAEVLGQAPSAPRTPLEAAMRDFLFAEVWSRPGLDRRARYLIAIAATTLNGGADDLIDAYVRGALKNGALTLAELREAALHLGGYGAPPRAVILDKAISRAEQALGLPAPEWQPIQTGPLDDADRIATGNRSFLDVMTFPNGEPTTPFLHAITEHVFAEIWTRPALDQRSRRWLTLAGVAESGREVPIKTHFYSAMTSGNCTAEEMHEFALHYAAHAGWHKASSIHGVLVEMIQKVDAGLPWYE